MEKIKEISAVERFLSDEKGLEFINFMSDICLRTMLESRLGSNPMEAAFFKGRESVFFDLIKMSGRDYNLKIKVGGE